MPAYDPRIIENFAVKAYKTGSKSIEIIIAKYEENFYIKNAIAFHHNVLIKSGRRHKSLCDLTSLNNFNENETKALKEAVEAVKQISKYGFEATLQQKVVKYSWFFDEPIIK